MKSRILKGIVPVLNTPLLEDHSIDTKGLKNLVDFLIEKGAGGFWALGTGSEDMNLTFEKRLKVARTVSKANAGRVPVILGAAFYAWEDCLQFLKETRDLDIDGYHVMCYHTLLGYDQVEWFYQNLADKCEKPLWMYSSANYGRFLTPEFVKRLKHHPNIQGIKYSTKNSLDIAKVIMLADDNFQVMSSVATTLLSCLSLGVKAHTTSIAGCLPEMLVNIYNLFVKGEMDQALEEQQNLIRFLGELPKKARQDNFFLAAEEKYILSLRGVCNEYTSSYYRDLNKEEKIKVKEILKKFNII